MKAKRIVSAIMSAMMLATGFTISAGSVSAVNEQPIEIAAEEQQTESVVTNATESVQKNLLSVPNVTAAQDVKPFAVSNDNPSNNEAEAGTQSPTEPATQAPTQPTVKVPAVENFKYGRVTTNSIELKWSAVQNASGYEIYRMDSKTGGKYVKYTVINSGSTASFTDSKLTPARCYYYRIKAFVKANGRCYYSSEKTVKLGTCPKTLTGLRVKSQSTNAISISWNKVNGASGYVIYRMDYKTKGKYKAIATVGGKVSSINNIKLESGRPYYYRVRAYKEVHGTKFYGGYPTLKTATLPDSVTNLKVKSQSTNNIVIQWSKVPRATGYVIYRMDASTNGKYKKYAVVKSSSTSYNNKNLTAGRCYYYRVKAYRLVDGKYYYGGYPTLKTGTKTVAPSFTLSSANKKITASWSKVSGAEGYSFYLAESKGGHYYLQGHTTGTSYTSKALTKGKTYYVRVCAYNLVDNKKIYSGYQTKSIACADKRLVHGYDVGDTYIEISIDKQHMWYYKNGKCLVSTNVVTGMKNSHDTTKGLFHIWERKSPARLVGETWDTMVNYWLAVTYDGIGIHDSTWRTGGYGGNIYTYDGSHGCINTPYDQAKKIYDNCSVGTPVVIY